MTDGPPSRVRPSGWWYVLVPVLLFAGIGFGVVAAVDEGRAVADSFSSLGPNGRGVVKLEPGDTATVMAVWEDGRASDSITRPAASVVITGPDGNGVAFEPASSGQQTFSFNSKSGVDLGTFEARSPGAHMVRVRFTQPGPLAAVVRLDWQDIVWHVLRPIGLGAAAAVGLWILLLVLRGMSKRRRRTSPQFQGTTPYTGGTNPSRGPFV